MKFAKGLLIFCLILIGLLATGIIYFYNEDKFYSEFWLQRQIDKFQPIEIIPSYKETFETIKYKFYHNSEIDILIEIRNDGKIIVTRNSWFNNSKEKRHYNFKFDKIEFEKLKNKFKNNWNESEMEYAGYKLGGLYYVLELTELENKTSIAFYNINPDKKFMDFKNEIISLTKERMKM